MVRFERRSSEMTEAAIAALARAKISNGTYNTPEVLKALQEVFQRKCYICEEKGIEAIEIEHLHPHKNDVRLKYDWENLYLSCRHCNNTKLGKYDPILDCCRVDVDKLIAFRKEGYFGKSERLSFVPQTDDEETQNTCRLLRDVYYGKTPQKQMEARILRRRVRQEMSRFKESVREYYEEDGEEKEDLRCSIIKSLKNSSPFAAFKRWLIKDNPQYCRDFLEFV